MDPTVDVSRDPKYLEDELKRRMNIAFKRYKKRYPDEPEPFLTATYRSPQEQDRLYAQGRSEPGNIITSAQGGSSYHNYIPAYAFDIAFDISKENGGPYARTDLFDKFGEIAEELGCIWGGSWKEFVDKPHIQVPNYSVKSAREEKSVPWTPLEDEYPIVTGDVSFNRVFMVTDDDIEELDLEKITLLGDKLYIKPK